MPNDTQGLDNTVYAGDGKYYRQMYQPGEAVSIPFNFSKRLPTGYAGFALGKLTYGIGTQLLAPVVAAPLVTVNLDLGAATAGTTGKVTVVATYTLGGATYTLEEEVTIVVTDR